MTEYRIPPRQFQPGTSNLTTPGFVYFIRGELTGLVKIGWATKPVERLKALQMGSPDTLYIAATLPGNGRDEKDLHRRFSDTRRHGEWFEATAELLAHIAEVLTADHAPYRPAHEPQPQPLEVVRPQKIKAEKLGPTWPPPQEYWEYGNPGWDKLAKAMEHLNY